MAGPFIDQAKWKQFMSADEAKSVAELEEAANMYLDILREIRANIEVFRNRHSWKTRKRNPYLGKKNK